MPPPPEPGRRVAIDAAPAIRARLVATLGAAVVVEPAAAEVVVRDLADDLAAARAIADGFGTPPAVVLLDDPHGALALGALRAGAGAVLARDAAPRELRVAVEAVALGLTVLGEDAHGALVTRAPGDDGAAPLTPREREVLDLLARGLSNRRIAERLGVSDHTVKAHVGAILAKLGAATRTEAVANGARRGWVML